MVCMHILPHSINHHLHVSNRSFTDVLNRKATGLNSFISDYCTRTPGLFFLYHNFQAFPLRWVLAKDSLHPSFAGVEILGRNLRAVLPVLLERLLRYQGLPASDPQWPTLAEAMELGRLTTRRREIPTHLDHRSRSGELAVPSE